MRRASKLWLLMLAAAAVLAPVVGSQSAGQPVLRGFTAERAAAQRELEEKLRRIPAPESAGRHLRALTSEPHMAGTAGSRRVAEYVRDRLREYGWEAELAAYQVWLPQPQQVQLELLAPERMALARQEVPIEADPDSHDQRAVVGFNGFSPSGEATAEVVFVNYGLPDDYAQLRKLGVSVEGRIAMARYGRSFRGVKSKVAEENKAAGLIIYSDPADDGYMAGDPYPRGPWRPLEGIQRGSVLYIFQYPGDPLTPGRASVEGIARIAPEKAESLTRVPTLPVAARDAHEIFKHLNGPRVPRPWQGGLPLTYHTGPGPARVRIKLEMDYRQRTIWNVIGRLAGARDEWVVVGNHHDAWVFGAVDPSSGTTVVLEMARALGQLARAGWKPRRSIVLGFWDAEEYGLIGSTEWVEQHREELRQKAVAYLNLDSAVSGDRFGASGSPSLAELVREAAREVTDPRTGRSVYELWRERAGLDNDREAAADVHVGPLGSGSDYTPFFHHIGVPSLDMGFRGEYGVYHSLYDSFHWMQTHGDPGFAYHAAAARLAGVVTLRLAEADVLPFDYTAYAADIGRYVAELVKDAQQAKAPLDLGAVRDAAAAFQAAAARAAKALASDDGAARNPGLSRALASVEQALLNPEGLLGRPWFRHTISAPGSYTGYAAVVLPGVREALDRKDWPAAEREATALAAALGRAAARLDEVARLARE